MPFGVGGEVLCLLYESLLTLAVRESGLLEFKDKALTGGGRIGSNEVGIVYVVLVYIQCVSVNGHNTRHSNPVNSKIDIVPRLP